MLHKFARLIMHLIYIPRKFIHIYELTPGSSLVQSITQGKYGLHNSLQFDRTPYLIIIIKKKIRILFSQK